MESSSVIDDSDYEEDSMKKLADENDESRFATIIDDSDEEATSSSRSSLGPSIASSLSSTTAEGRLTPSIFKAIRRSIHHFEKESSDEEEKNSDDEEVADVAASSDNSDDAEPIVRRFAKRNVISDDSSEEELELTARKLIEEVDSPEERRSEREQRSGMAPKSMNFLKNNEAESDEIASDEDESYVEVSPIRDQSRNFITETESPGREQLMPQFPAPDDSASDLEIVDVPKKGLSVADILSSSDEKENGPDNALETSIAISLAREESHGSTIDPVMAQKRAILVYNQQQIEAQLAKSKMIFNTGNMAALPDKGERLRLSIMESESDLAKVTEELNQIQLQQSSLASPKAKVLAPLFKQDSLEVNSVYLRPTTESINKELGKRAQETLQREQSLTLERLQDLHGSLLARPAEDEKAQDPRGLKIPLMPHQQHALAWLLWRERQKPPGGVLADDMGLGKTLTMISLVMAAIARSETGEERDAEDDWQSSARPIKHHGGTLVVAPASLLAQWEAEVKNRCKRGLLSVELYHGNNRESIPRRLAKSDIVVTTYNLLSREFKSEGVLYKIRWRRVILDEAHVIRNHKSQTCDAVCGLHADKRWALTGTPIHNKEMDLYSLLKFLRCSPFDDARVWKRWVDNKNAAGHERLATVMKTIMLRRTKAELQAKGELESLPDKSIEVIEITLDPEERLVYDKIMVYSRTLFAQFLSQRAEKDHMFELGAGKYDKPSWMTPYKDTQFTKAQNKLLSLHADVKSHEILVLLLRLRQVCCHPSLINAMLDQEDIEQTGLEEYGADIDLSSKMEKVNIREENEEHDGDIGVDQRVAEHLLTSDNPVFNPKRQSSKMRTVLAKVDEIMAKGEKMIIVSQWVGVLNVIADELDSKKGVSYRMFTGQVAVKDRQGIIDDFNSPNAKLNVLLLSLTAGGVGLNLVGANHLLLIDIHWNPQLESQAQDRIYRFGQKKNVFIYKYICSGTIEERIKQLQEKKLELATAVLSGGGKVVGSKLSLDDIKSLFSL